MESPHTTHSAGCSHPLDAGRFAECFTEWIRTVSEITEGQIVAIDGKTIRRSHDSRAGRSAIHVVSAWASANRLALGQTRVDDKSNEITAIPKLLAMLELSGRIVTIDAMGLSEGDSLKDHRAGRGLHAVSETEPAPTPRGSLRDVR